MLHEPPWYGTVRPVVWEDGGSNPASYPIESSPVIGSTGRIIFGSSRDYVYALKSDRTLCWRYETGGNVTSSPAIDTAGTVYVGSEDNRLYSI